jgi:plastocyanin
VTQRWARTVPALALTLALAGAGVVEGADSSAAAPGAKRSPAAGACAKHHRAHATCRRTRAAAAYRRSARRGRALLAGPVAGAPGRPTSAPAGNAQPGAAEQTPAPGPNGATPPPSDAPARVAGSVGAEAFDFGSFVLRLTRTSVAAGDLTIYFRNHDVSEHNLWLQAPPASGAAAVLISEAVGENGGAAKTVAVTPGTWRLYCSLPGHEAMTSDLTVG